MRAAIGRARPRGRDAPRRLGGIGTMLALWALFAIVPASAPAGNDLDLRVGPVEQIGNVLTVSYEAGRPFTPRLAETMERGMPATITFEIGLWKRRALWFDKLLLALKSEHRVVYDEWDGAFRVRTGTTTTSVRRVPDLDSLSALLFAQRRLPIAAYAPLDSTGTHYVSVKLRIKPLTVEDLGEIEDWLSGEEKKDSGGGGRGVPRYLMELAVNLSGLGDRSAIAKSEQFKPAELLDAGASPALP